MSKKINGTKGRVYTVGGSVLEDGTIIIDLKEKPDRPIACGNIPIRELIEHLNTLEGVTATYQKPHREVPQGIGAVVEPKTDLGIKLVRVLTGPGTNWVQNLKAAAREGDYAWYTDVEIDEYLNDYDYVITSEGVTE